MKSISVRKISFRKISYAEKSAVKSGLQVIPKQGLQLKQHESKQVLSSLLA
jgi:hypothetical protein